MFEKLFPGGGAALRASMLAQVDRPSRFARPNSFSGGMEWEDAADTWTDSGVTWGTGVVDRLGARVPMAATTTENSVAVTYTTRTLPRKQDKGSARGTGARWTAIFSPVAGINEMTVYLRGPITGTPSGGEEVGSWGISRLNGETQLYAFMRGSSGASVRKPLGAYTVGHVYFGLIEVVGAAMEISVYNMTDRKWLSRARFSGITVPPGPTRLAISAKTAAGGVAASLEIGEIRVFPEFVNR